MALGRNEDQRVSRVEIIFFRHRVKPRGSWGVRRQTLTRPTMAEVASRRASAVADSLSQHAVVAAAQLKGTATQLQAALSAAASQLRANTAVAASWLRATWPQALDAARKQPWLFAGPFALLLLPGSIALLRRPRLRQEAGRATSPTSERLPVAFHQVVLDPGAKPRKPKVARAPGAEADGASEPMQIVLTGGPLGGKSSLAARLSDELQNLGVTVYVAPSVAAMLFNCGCARPDATDADAILSFEIAVLQLQLQLEASFQRIARASGERCAIIYDRGVLDVAAYLPRELWGELARQAPQEQRPIDYYRAIVHMVTAADGAASDAAFDDARGGSRAEALRLDAAIHEVQRSHPNYLRVDNSSDFDGKLRRATEAILAKLDLKVSEVGATSG